MSLAIKQADKRSLAIIERFFDERGWTAFQFQRDTWAAYAAGRSGLIHAPTGFGKTYAAFCGPCALSPIGTEKIAPPITVLWITPLKALAADTTLSLKDAAATMQPTWTVGLRTGDVASSERAKQDRRLPTVLVTTPESLALMLAKADWRERLSSLRCVIVDEWHELMSSKRGTLLELGLARLRGASGSLQTWGMSATLGNLDEAMRVLLGVGGAEAVRAQQGVLISAKLKKDIVIDSLMPATIERFPWAGHLGLKLLPEVIAQVETCKSTLIFTNTRSQTELWYQALLDARPDWAGLIALHHGSLDKATREYVETGIKSGALMAVVCTSSLDLGVDFRPVEQVLQIGSPKGVARLLQRAGRSGHQPGAKSRVTVVPTHALELVEAAAARRAASAMHIESRVPIGSGVGGGLSSTQWRPLDVLTQHMVSAALGGGFDADELRAEVETTLTYLNLTDAEWRWCLDFVTRGGASLSAYPDFHKVVIDPETGRYLLTDRRIAMRHRTNIGTIVSDASITVQFLGGARLGQVEEDFIARLNVGDAFIFAGRVVEFIRVREMTAYVRRATKKRNLVPRWGGGKMPLSTQLAGAARDLIAETKHRVYSTPETQLCAPLFELQAKISALPDHKEWLVESLKSKEGWHLFFFPFEGRLVHLGLATLFSYRLAQTYPELGQTFSIAINDYGFELLSPTEVSLSSKALRELLDSRQVEHDILAGLNAAELGKRQFREIARVAGLIDQGYPGQNKSSKQLQASSGLLFDVFTTYDGENLLLKQAVREVLERQLEASRLTAALLRLRGSKALIMACDRPTPFSFPLMVERLRETLSTEQIEQRVARMVAELNATSESAVTASPTPRKPRPQTPTSASHQT